jgi:hypothetical protein
MLTQMFKLMDHPQMKYFSFFHTEWKKLWRRKGLKTSVNECNSLKVIISYSKMLYFMNKPHGLRYCTIFTDWAHVYLYFSFE